jgi:DNA-binding beta-propeller fold protein YncE
VSDSTNNKIYQVTAAGVVTALAGSGAAGFADGVGTVAMFSGPGHLVWASTGGEEVLFIADRNNNRIRRLVVSSSEVNTIAGSGIAGFADGSCSAGKFNTPQGIAFSGATAAIYAMDTGNQRLRQLQ